MNVSDSLSEIPEWILGHLKKYGNCCCGRDIVKKIGKEQILSQLKEKGFNCILRIVPDNRFYPLKRKTKYPVNAYYILEVECIVRSYYVKEL